MRFDAPSEVVAGYQAEAPPLQSAGSKERREYEFSASCEGDSCPLTLAPDCTWTRNGAHLSGPLPSRENPGGEPPGCNTPGYDRTISSFTDVSLRVRDSIETADGLVATTLRGAGTFLDYGYWWWNDADPTRRVAYAQLAEVRVVARRLDAPAPLPTTTTTSSTTTTSTTTSSTTSTTVTPTTTVPPTTTTTGAGGGGPAGGGWRPGVAG